MAAKNQGVKESQEIKKETTFCKFFFFRQKTKAKRVEPATSGPDASPHEECQCVQGRH